MDPTKPASKANNGGALPISRRTAEPKKSFRETLAATQGTDEAAALRIAEEQMAIQMSRSILNAPKPSRGSVQREKSESEEEGGSE
jgi:hypothetical protein